MKRIGIVGLGRGATALLPSILSHPDFEIVALCEKQKELREIFCADFEVNGYAEVSELCADPQVDIVYVATPHQFHRDHAVAALSAGKHALVEKPMALTLKDCDEMIRAADLAGTVLMVGYSYGYDPPILALRDIVQNKQYGRLRMINAMNYSDFLYRPRRPEELDTSLGGGIMYNQIPHQVEMVRTIAGSRVVRVSAVCGVWDDARPTEGASSCLIRFEDGVVANLVFSGYAHLDTLRFYGGLDNEGSGRDYTATRKSLSGVNSDDEANMKAKSGYLAQRDAILGPSKLPTTHNRWGLLIASFEHADVVQSPTGLIAYTDDGVEQLVVPFGGGGGRRATVLDELSEAIDGKTTMHDGRWGRDTTAVCLAALRSSAIGEEVAITDQG